MSIHRKGVNALRTFTAEELREIERFDRSLEDEPVTLEEYHEAKQLDREAKLLTTEPEQRRICERMAKNYAENKYGTADRQRAQSKAYNAAHAEEKKEYIKMWRAKNADAVREYQAAWRTSNKERIAEYDRCYYEGHKEYIRERNHERAKRRWASMTPEQKEEHYRKAREWRARKKAEAQKRKKAAVK